MPAKPKDKSHSSHHPRASRPQQDQTPDAPAAAPSPALTLRSLTDRLLAEQDILQRGGGEAGLARQRKLDRLSVRQRLAGLLDPKTPVIEIGLWAAWRMYPEVGEVPAAGVVTCVGSVAGRSCMVVANDATVKAGAFFPATAKKVIRAQKIAARCNLPLIYLVDSAGVFLPMQDEIFPDEDDFGRIFRNNAVLSAAGVPQFAAIMGNCIAGGAYLPVLCDKILMTSGSALNLAGPALVKAAIGQEADAEELGGAVMHSTISGTVDFHEPDDETCLKRLRSLVALLPPMSTTSPAAGQGGTGALTSPVSATPAGSETGAPVEPADDERATARSAAKSVTGAKSGMAAKSAKPATTGTGALLGPQNAFVPLSSAAPPAAGENAAEGPSLQPSPGISGEGETRDPSRTPPSPPLSPASPLRNPLELYELMDVDGRQPYDARDLLNCIVDGGSLIEYKADYGKTLVCAYAALAGRNVGIVANQRQITKTAQGESHIGGVIYQDSADKAARFVMDCSQNGLPLVFFQDVQGFMVGRDSEQHGIIRSGAKLVNAVSNATVPKLTVVLGGSFGAGNYALCGKAFDPVFIFAWPCTKYAVMGAAQAAGTLLTLHQRQAERGGKKLSDDELRELRDRVTADYAAQTDIRYGAARGWVDAIIAPDTTRDVLIHALELASRPPATGGFRGGIMQV